MKIISANADDMGGAETLFGFEIRMRQMAEDIVRIQEARNVNTEDKHIKTIALYHHLPKITGGKNEKAIDGLAIMIKKERRINILQII